ncbi:hypothetical protein DW091_16580 [Eubacterium sp. AM05-23]|nr:hypothetical protein DW091_16580 [Eubacterium sp. AM05-23]
MPLKHKGNLEINFKNTLFMNKYTKRRDTFQTEAGKILKFPVPAFYYFVKSYIMDINNYVHVR